MLRITTNEKTQCLTLRLEGRLEGLWVDVLDQSWSGALHKLRGRRLRVDLNGVTFVDAQGKAALAQMYGRGAELIADDLETKALVTEIRTGRTGDGGDGNGASKRVSGPKEEVNFSEQLTQLQRLRAELNAVNEALVQAARPLERLADLNDAERHQVADQMRVHLARWESVTQQIAQVLGIDSGNGQVTPKRSEGGSR